MQTNNISRKRSAIQAGPGKYRLVSKEMKILVIRRLTLTRNTSSLQIYYCLRIRCKSNDFFPDTEKEYQRGSPRRPKRLAVLAKVAGWSATILFMFCKGTDVCHTKQPSAVAFKATLKSCVFI